MIFKNYFIMFTVGNYLIMEIHDRNRITFNLLSDSKKEVLTFSQHTDC